MTDEPKATDHSARVALLLRAAAERGESAALGRTLAHRLASRVLDGRDEQGRTPLLLAAAGLHLDLCETLLAAGADPLARDYSGCGVLGALGLRGKKAPSGEEKGRASRLLAVYGGVREGGEPAARLVELHLDLRRMPDRSAASNFSIEARERGIGFLGPRSPSFTPYDTDAQGRKLFTALFWLTAAEADAMRGALAALEGCGNIVRAFMRED